MSYQKTLQCRLTETEHRERGQALALARHERNEREADRKAKAAALKALVDEADEEVDRLALIVRSGSEPRPVECVDSVHGYEVVTIRLDTGEEVGRRAATDADRQMALPMDPDREAAAAAIEAVADARSRRRSKAAPAEPQA